MSHTFSELREMSREQLISEHDKIALHSQVSVAYYLAEIFRKDQEEQTNQMIGFTKQIRLLTVIVTTATIINLILFALK